MAIATTCWVQRCAGDTWPWIRLLHRHGVIATTITLGGSMNKNRALRFGSLTLIAALAAVLGRDANAQTATPPSTAATSTAPTPEEVQGDVLSEIVVTGSSLRGVAPVGSNIISVDAQQIANTGAQTVAEAIATMPSIEG